MSRLQIALHALPPRSIVSIASLASTAEMNAVLDAQRLTEIEFAKQIQNELRCSWGEALRKSSEGSPKFLDFTPLEWVKVRTGEACERWNKPDAYAVF